jgi:hypothetical protein
MQADQALTFDSYHLDLPNDQMGRGERSFITSRNPVLACL